MTAVETDSIIDRLMCGCIWNKFEEPGVLVEYQRFLLKYNYTSMNLVVDSILENNSKNVPAISEISGIYKNLRNATVQEIENKEYCSACDDKGYIMVKEYIPELKQSDFDAIYEYVTYCPFCEVGKAQAYDGRKRSERKSKYFVPCITSYLDETAINKMRQENMNKRYAKEEREGLKIS